MDIKYYRIYDPQCGRYKGDGKIYGSKKHMWKELVEYHEIDWGGENSIYDWIETFKGDDNKLGAICEYGDWTIEEYTEGKNILYCDICSEAHVVLNREVEKDDLYICTMCRDYKKDIRLNTISDGEVLDFNS